MSDDPAAPGDVAAPEGAATPAGAAPPVGGDAPGAPAGPAEAPGPGRLRWLWLVAAGLVVALVGGVIGGLIVDAAQTSDSSGDSACYAIGVAERTLPSVVTISARGARSGSGTGSGAVIRDDGHIITNDHVISVAADGGSVSVQFDDSVTVPATIVGRDPLTDLAVLDIDADEHDVVPIPLGSTEDVLSLIHI